jgi:D-alanine-D-alanine ligase
VKRAQRTPRPLRVLVLMHKDLIPPEEVKISGPELEDALWKSEHDVLRTLRELGHEARPLGVGSDLAPIRAAVEEWKPHIVFNLVEGFDDIASYDQNVVALLELMRVRYTGCNSRGLLLARDKALAKKLLAYHRIPVPAFAIIPRGRAVRRPKRLAFPLFVKSLTLDASTGISQASVVETDAKLGERVRFIHESVGTHALVESYVEGRELYVGVLGNERLQALPIWELHFSKLPEESRPIATERLKWSAKYRTKHGIDSGPARDLDNGLTQGIQRLCKRAYRILMLSGCARMDLRLTEGGRAYVIEANPNPQLSHDEDFAQSAQQAGLGYAALLERLLNLGMRWDPTRSG